VVSDSTELNDAVEAAIAENPDIVTKVQGGKEAAAGPLIGAVMRATRGRADAAVVRKLILASIEKRKRSF